MDMRRVLLIVASVLAAGGCVPRDPQVISAPDPMDSIPAIQKAAATNDQAAVPALVIELNNDDPAIRFYAFQALQRLTGKDFGYHFYDDNDQRRPAIDRWKQWLGQRKSQ